MKTSGAGYITRFEVRNSFLAAWNFGRDRRGQQLDLGPQCVRGHSRVPAAARTLGFTCHGVCSAVAWALWTVTIVITLMATVEVGQ